MGWHKSRYPLNQCKGVRPGATARQDCRAKTAQEQDLCNLTGIIGTLPIPCAFSIGAAKGCRHCLAQTGGFNKLPGFKHGQKRASCGQQRTRTLIKCAMRGEWRSAKRCVRKDMGHWWDLRESRKVGSRPDTLSQPGGSPAPGKALPPDLVTLAVEVWRKSRYALRFPSVDLQLSSHKGWR